MIEEKQVQQEALSRLLLHVLQCIFLVQLLRESHKEEEKLSINTYSRIWIDPQWVFQHQKENNLKKKFFVKHKKQKVHNTECLKVDLNHWHEDFQSSALPTELFKRDFFLFFIFLFVIVWQKRKTKRKKKKKSLQEKTNKEKEATDFLQYTKLGMSTILKKFFHMKTP